ncbi:LpxB: lipid-A-disaccharide synthase [Desulfosarcina variabilis str. Montpellier]|uniref:lipid-A-disaccharide synthase n=1 Tax=Desulfosarcina variabilis TaxID=2300 RepID=UPI003AFA60DA
MPVNRMMIIAGEASGDMHGAKLAQSIKKMDHQSFIFGVGGSAMKAEGVQLLVDASILSVVGITEVFSNLPTIYRSMSIVKKALRQLKPNLLILIDFPDFNFHVAEFAKKLGIPILYYISPQIWAWRQGRVKKIKRLVDHMAVIFPFEAAFYRKHQVPVTFVGHPLLDRIAPVAAPVLSSDFQDAPTIGLLPGSREKEVSTLLPVMLEACKKIQKVYSNARFNVSCSDSIHADRMMDIVNRHNADLDVDVIKGRVEQVIRNSQILVAASGTVTLEAALYGVPTVIVYKVSPTSYWLGRRLIKVKHIGIVNLIVQKSLLPELIQDDASPENIAGKIIQMVNDPRLYMQITDALSHVRKRLGGSGASDRVARIALNLCR